MAFSARDMAVLAYAQGFTLWLLKTRDTLHQVRAPGYLSEAGGLVGDGDLLVVSAADGCALQAVHTDDLGHDPSLVVLA